MLKFDLKFVVFIVLFYVCGDIHENRMGIGLADSVIYRFVIPEKKIKSTIVYDSIRT